jgi:membrane protein implicated in regulation of membrane protease activity
LVIVQLGKPSLNSAMDFFYTANDSCLQNGPGFTFDYYITYTGIISAGVSLASALLYQKFMSNWKFRNVLIFTSILVGLGGLTDLVIVLRLNVSVGVPDKAFYIFGNAIIENTVRMLYWIPSSAIISKVCPKNMEATTYAFLAGISNFGSMTSSMLGALIFKTAGITTVVGQCNFDALWWLILAFHILLPVCTGIGASFLIPNKNQTEELINDSEGSERNGVMEMLNANDDFEMEVDNTL